VQTARCRRAVAAALRPYPPGGPSGGLGSKNALNGCPRAASEWGVRELPSWVSRNRVGVQVPRPGTHPCLRPLGSPDALAAGFPGAHPLVGCPKTHLRMGVRATVTAGVVEVHTAAHGRTPQVHSTASARAPVAVCWVSTSRRVSTSRNSLGVQTSPGVHKPLGVHESPNRLSACRSIGSAGVHEPSGCP
jgi:hypothetical protein